MMTLTRPLVGFDLETTSTDPKTARIVEMSIIKMGVNGNIIETSARFNPGMPIPPEATAVHGITDDDVKDCQPFAVTAQKLLAFITGCDILTYNGNRFDIPLLFEEFSRSGLHWDTTGLHFIDALRIFQKYSPRNLAAAYKFYTGNDLEGAHGAAADIRATWDVFTQQLKQHEDLPQDLAGIASLCNGDKPRLDLYGNFSVDADGDYIFNFGKNKGLKCKNEQNYLQWMAKSDFSNDTKNWVWRMLNEFQGIK